MRVFRGAQANGAKDQVGSHRAEERATSVPQDPAAIQQQIENTRAELAVTLDAIAELVSPRRIAERTGEQIRGRVAELRQKVISGTFAGPDAITAGFDGDGEKAFAVDEARDGQVLAGGTESRFVLRRTVRWDRVIITGSVLLLVVGAGRRRRRRRRAW